VGALKNFSHGQIFSQVIKPKIGRFWPILVLTLRAEGWAGQKSVKYKKCLFFQWEFILCGKIALLPLGKFVKRFSNRRPSGPCVGRTGPTLGQKSLKNALYKWLKEQNEKRFSCGIIFLCNPFCSCCEHSTCVWNRIQIGKVQHIPNGLAPPTLYFFCQFKLNLKMYSFSQEKTFRNK
jgi:hypothetical protein